MLFGRHDDFHWICSAHTEFGDVSVSAQSVVCTRQTLCQSVNSGVQWHIISEADVYISN